MSTIHTLGEVRPSVTSGDPHAETFTIPLLRLRGYDRPVIRPEECRVPGCLVCQWRRAGLLDSPVLRVVREPASGYTCHSSFCPGCNTLRCVCLPEGYEDAVYEHDYALGHEHGTADGPDNRPTRRWCMDAGLDADAYLDGYDAGCAGVVLMPANTAPVRLWDELDDGLPF
ncbi:MAG TPA: hypothetical protein VGB53_06350 [Rubricoccaceae bacterium]|jgi:hypothetical protein